MINELTSYALLMSLNFCSAPASLQNAQTNKTEIPKSVFLGTDQFNQPLKKFTAVTFHFQPHNYKEEHAYLLKTSKVIIIKFFFLGGWGDRS